MSIQISVTATKEEVICTLSVDGIEVAVEVDKIDSPFLRNLIDDEKLGMTISGDEPLYSQIEEKYPVLSKILEDRFHFIDCDLADYLHGKSVHGEGL